MNAYNSLFCRCAGAVVAAQRCFNCVTADFIWRQSLISIAPAAPFIVPLHLTDSVPWPSAIHYICPSPVSPSAIFPSATSPSATFACSEYAINAADSANGIPGVLYGRYGGDTYAGCVASRSAMQLQQSQALQS